MVKSSLNVSFADELSNSFPILVAGLPGVPGYNAFFHLRALFPGRVLGLCPPHLPSLPETVGAVDGSGLVTADAEDPAQLARIFDEFEVRAVVDATGWCALKSCELDVPLARRLNVDVGRNLMEQARRRGARLLRLSTDLVFDGREGARPLAGYPEDFPVSPVTVYGKMMAESERVILSGYPDAAVLRIALPMGPSFNGHAGAIDWIESRFKKNRPATLYFDEVRSSLYVQDLNAALLRFLACDARGLFHVGGPLPLSLYQIAQVINRVGEYDPDLLMGCPRAHAGPIPPRAGDVRMDGSKAASILPAGLLNPWPLRVEAHVDRLSDRDWHRRRGTRFTPGSVARLLYGHTWPEASDHPLHLIPTVSHHPQAAVLR